MSDTSNFAKINADKFSKQNRPFSDFVDYVATIEQSGAGAPTGIVLSDSISPAGSSVQWSRNSSGVYKATFPVNLDAAKLFLNVSAVERVGAALAQTLEVDTANTLLLTNRNNLGVLLDGLHCAVEVRLYN